MAAGALLGGISFFARRWNFYPYWVLILFITFLVLRKLFRARLERQPLDLEAA
jgi:Na+/H+ antiporter NhaD/arsenite permease-like protein